jgi:LCP family protein required for cell wall assembly
MKRKIIFLLGLTGTGLFLGFFIFIRPYYVFLTKKVGISPLKTLLSHNDLKTYKNQVNILILGIAGENHDGPNLSDSIMVANYNFDTNQITIISLPRDIWSPTLRDKINTAYAYGEAKQEGGGIKLAKAEIEAIVDTPVHYGAVIDFAKFKELIDVLGGIDVDVKRSFTDKKFPIAGKENDECDGDPEYRCRYETISFQRGLIHMNGETALKYVRSRHADNEEGSDFARAKRQQQIIEATKNKILEIVKKTNIAQIDAIYSAIDKLVARDITNQQAAGIVKSILLGKNFRQKQILLSEDFFEIPDYNLYDGKYVLIPKNNDFTRIHEYVSCNLGNTTPCESSENKGNED